MTLLCFFVGLYHRIFELIGIADLLLVTQATDLSLRAIEYRSVVFGVTLRLFVMNISSLSPAINKLRRLLPAVCHNLRDRGPARAMLITSGRSQHLQHAVKPDIAMPFAVEKLEWLGYPRVKNVEDVFIHLTEFTNVTDRQINGQRHRMTTYAALAQHRAAKTAEQRIIIQQYGDWYNGR